jgi:hypothetical protein
MIQCDYYRKPHKSKLLYGRRIQNKSIKTLPLATGIMGQEEG